LIFQFRICITTISSREQHHRTACTQSATAALYFLGLQMESQQLSQHSLQHSSQQLWQQESQQFCQHSEGGGDDGKLASALRGHVSNTTAASPANTDAPASLILLRLAGANASLAFL